VSGAVLLDALGTLVDFEDPAPLLRAALAGHGVEVDDVGARAAVRAEIGFYRREHGAAGDRAALADLRRRCAEVVREALAPAADGVATDDLVEALVDSFRFAPFPEVPEVLGELRGRGHPLAVVSNWDVSLHDVLQATGLRPCFGAVVVSAEIGVAKPDPEPFRRALAALGAEAGGALHAGDRLDEDVAGARAAGIMPVLVDRAGGAAADGVAVVASLDGLLDLEP
jgi:putative hydrolase of the HAD superfamily